MNPRVIAREQIEEGQPMMMVLVPEMHQYYRLTPDQWVLLQLFDGNRTYQEVAEEFSARTSIAYTAELAQEFAEASPEAGFWYQTQQEKNFTLCEKLKQERSERIKRKSKFSNLAEVSFAAWDPDVFLTKLHAHLEFLFSRWFLLLSLALFTFMGYVFVSHWGEIGRDSLDFFDFTTKGTADLVAFWVLMFLIGFVHETCHGLGCKHTGGEVHGMGFLLIYLSPAFYCDTTEAFVYGGKWAKNSHGSRRSLVRNDHLLAGYPALVGHSAGKLRPRSRLHADTGFRHPPRPDQSEPPHQAGRLLPVHRTARNCRAEGKINPIRDRLGKKEHFPPAGGGSLRDASPPSSVRPVYLPFRRL